MVRRIVDISLDLDNEIRLGQPRIRTLVRQAIGLVIVSGGFVVIVVYLLRRLST